jgi:hypothetical protein
MTYRLRALTSRKTYQTLQAVRRNIASSTDPQAASPFVAVGPTPSTTIGPRILIVEQCATINEDEPDDFDAAVASTRRQLFTKWSKSPLWAVISLAVTRLLGESDGGILRPHVGWTNVAKIGSAGGKPGNPSQASLIEQVNTCASALREEIGAARPHAVILISGPSFGRAIVDRVFETGAWSEYSAAGKARFRTQNSPLGPVFWTDSPGALRYRKSEAEVGDAITNWGAGLSMPNLR